MEGQKSLVEILEAQFDWGVLENKERKEKRENNYIIWERYVEGSTTDRQIYGLM